jgi:hypothetical protein
MTAAEDAARLAAIVARQAGNLNVSVELNAALAGQWRCWFSVVADTTTWHAESVGQGTKVHADTAGALVGLLCTFDPSTVDRLGVAIDRIGRHM